MAVPKTNFKRQQFGLIMPVSIYSSACVCAHEIVYANWVRIAVNPMPGRVVNIHRERTKSALRNYCFTSNRLETVSVNIQSLRRVVTGSAISGTRHTGKVVTVMLGEIVPDTVCEILQAEI